MSAVPPTLTNRWLLLLHELPAKPHYLRVKLWRRLQRLGAVTIKKGVYVLPRGEEQNEDLQWVIREAVEGGGEASLCEASFIQGMSNEQVESLFNRARDADYAKLAGEARTVLDGLSKKRAPAKAHDQAKAELKRLKARVGEVQKIDFFGSSGSEAVHAVLRELEARLASASATELSQQPATPADYRGRVWVTRKGVFVDRIASAWLIRRFIDAEATFKFVPSKGYLPEPGELRFDMFEAEFTHIGNRCTFEVLLDKMALTDRGLRPIAEVVHDIDIKDGRYGRPQTPGLEALLSAIAAGSPDDEERIRRGSAVLDDLYDFFRRKRP